MNPAGALEYILLTVIDIYIMIVLARFMLQLVRADFYNPVSQFVVKATSPVLNPLRRVIPGFGGLDIAAIILMLVLVALKLALYFFLKGALGLPILTMVIFFIKSVANTFLNFFLFSIFVSIILSWVAQGSYNPLADLLHQITEPVMGPARKILPPMGGLDLSPMLVLLAISAIKILFGLNGMP